MNDRTGIRFARNHVARRDPALESVPLQGLDNSIRGGNILRGVTKTLPVLATQDRGLKKRIKASLNLLDQIQDGELRTLRAEVDDIRKAFCVPVGGLGSVVLVQAQKRLIERVNNV